MRKALRTLMAHRQVMPSPQRHLKVPQPHPQDSARLEIPVVPVDQVHRPVISFQLTLYKVSNVFTYTCKLDMVL